LTRPVTSARERAAIVARAAADKHGADIAVLEVGDIISITEAFVIVSANNTRQVRTIVEEIEAKLKEHGDGALGAAPISIEGLDDASWVLMDYGDVVVHVFLADTRAYYDLDRLWADAPRVAWEQIGTAAQVR
jgi:ribosome-associated protein